MRESRTYGSGRGARGNSRPYREIGFLTMQVCCNCSRQELTHRVDSLRCEGSDAIGAKRTCRERRPKPSLWTANLFLAARRDEWIDNGAIVTGE